MQVGERDAATNHGGLTGPAMHVSDHLLVIALAASHVGHAAGALQPHPKLASARVSPNPWRCLR